jgi:O-succinylbenzoate synthase
MKIERVTLREIAMPLVHFFETSFSRTTERHMILVEAAAGGVSGWGEVTAGENPFYNEEWTGSAWPLLRDYAIPRVLGRELAGAADVYPLTAHIRGHKMARGGLEAAIWDLEARQKGVPLWQAIGGGARREIPCGVSIGIQDSIAQLLETIDRELAAGYQRIKMKIKPGHDIDAVRQVRERFPAIKLMVDANSAYTLADTEHLRKLDDYYLMMIEQPLAHDDIIDHAQLQATLQTPICLDESIRTAHHAEQAIKMRACGIINIKLGRVGGFSEAIAVHNAAQERGFPVWCGGMLESGVGRSHNIALSTLENFSLPGDVSASKRYWKEDIIEPEVTVTPEGEIEVLDTPGRGYEVRTELVERLTVRKETIRALELVR